MILAIETSGLICGVTLHDGVNIVCEKEEAIPRAHDTSLVRLIRDVLDERSVSYGALKAIAISIGPGSFTGLRIGLSAAKALCYSRNIPLIPVPTMNALAAAAVPEARQLGCSAIYTATVATAGKLYFCSFHTDGVPREECRIVEPGLGIGIAAGSAESGEGNRAENALVIGDAASYFTIESFPSVVRGSDGFSLPHARYIADYGATMYSQGDYLDDARSSAPLYGMEIAHRKMAI